MLGQFGEAQHHIDQAMAAIEATGERVWTAEVHRLAGEIALSVAEPDAVKAQAHFEHALAIARQASRQNPGNCAPR